MAGSLQDRLTRLAGQGAQAVAGAVAAWPGGVRQLAEALPDPTAVVNGVFDVAEEVLRAQREAALEVLRLAGHDRGWSAWVTPALRTCSVLLIARRASVGVPGRAVARARR